jgi:hypothetical protein
MKRILAITCRVIVTLTLFFLGTSCSVSKRHHMRGYYVEWKKKPTHTVAGNSRHEANRRGAPTTPPASITLQEPATADISADADPEPRFMRAGRRILAAATPPDSCRDEILMRNGELVQAKIEEVNSAEVRYRRCDNPGGPLYTTSTANIFSVTYANGLKRVFTRPAAPASVNTPASAPRTTSGWAVASFICALLGIFLIPLLPAFIFGIVGYQQIEKQPQRYKGKWMAIVGIVIGSLALLGLLILLVLVFI